MEGQSDWFQKHWLVDKIMEKATYLDDTLPYQQRPDFSHIEQLRSNIEACDTKELHTAVLALFEKEKLERRRQHQEDHCSETENFCENILSLIHDAIKLIHNLVQTRCKKLEEITSMTKHRVLN